MKGKSGTDKSTRPRMLDVAAAAGISVATVSRALARPDIVSKNTLAKVKEAIGTTGYVYNASAADFTRQRSNLVGLIVFTMRSSIQSELIDGVQTRLHEDGFALIVGNSQYDPDTETQLIRLFEERKLAGAIVAESTDTNREALHRLAEAGVPVVITWELTDEIEFDCVGIDNRQAAYTATSHLVSLGHRRIGLIAGRYDRIERVRHRFEGYEAALAEANIALDETLCYKSSPTLENGETAMAALLDGPEPPTAVFAASDTLALGALSAASVRGVRVPEDMSIIGFDDLEFSRFTCPPLTTIRVPVHEMGRLAASLVVENHQPPAEGTKKTPKRITLPTELVLRCSTAPIGERSSLSGCDC